MVSKLKLLLMFVTVVGVSGMVLNITGISSQAYAQDATTAKSKECPLDKPGRCSSNIDCNKKTKCNKEGGCNIDKMMDLTRCAKKELLKEKIKANLEKKMGAKMDKVADLLVNAMLEEYKSSMENKAQRTALEKNIREVLSGTDKQ
ncbi:hypothetical protein SCALIN_C28_0245 [Candidatus Scalindua japonica]|uniref:Uncharacterized protein n=1 Tax=Candidatus Scalindua japonica TaxID=1284222 RepID=A0A286U1M4_9BACT|nr:hypothetical protein [Candidatus Scalindua japonica]GAX62043.1 hypothetical protein SCALIN_C28_0245 [Candidatus Scalindua japonica]